MKLSERGAVFIRRHEGFRSRAYNDPVGILTIGIGFTWRSKTFKQWWRSNKRGLFGAGSRMTKAEADDCLRYLVDNEYGLAVNNITKSGTPQHAFDAACSMVYNCGPGALRWKWGKAYKAGNFRLSADLLTTTATTAKGKKLAGLVRRRKEEAALMRSGKYTGEKIHKANDYTREAQKLLAAYGFRLTVDGIAGPKTIAAVKAFQREKGLFVDGIIGPKTMAALRIPKQPDIPTIPTPKPTSTSKPKTGWWTAILNWFRG
ncbi:MAG: glycoside hydrolase family protein [Chloroflexi bacterium]|nr:glycoside hydrolase family protein [Chloroflexota bacterium]